MLGIWQHLQTGSLDRGKLEICFEEVAQSLEPPWRWIGCHQHVHGTLDDTVLPCQFFQHFVECEIMWQRESLVKIGNFQIFRRNQHILIQLSPPSMSLTTLPQPNRDLFFDWRCRWPPPDSSNLARTKLQGLKDWQQKKRGNLSSWICNLTFGKIVLATMTCYFKRLMELKTKTWTYSTSCILEWSLSFLVRFPPVSTK